MGSGRKRTFDKEEALDTATQLFWKNGYSGTSLADLSAELGINKPSLYAAFGNKERLFESSLEHYRNRYAMPVSKHLIDSPDAPFKKRVKAFIYGFIDLFTSDDTPSGCFFIKSRCESSSGAFPTELMSWLREMELANDQIMMGLLEPEFAKGKFSESVKLEDISGYVFSIIFGLAIHAQIGKNKKTLRAIADVATDNLPCEE